MTSQKIQAEDITQIRYKGIRGSLWNAVEHLYGEMGEDEAEI